MSKKALLGIGKHLLPLPDFIWKRQIAKKARQATAVNLTFMSAEHHRVRDFVVGRLHRAGHPLSPGYIGHALGLSRDRVNDILASLEKRLVFLFRNARGEVTWAYPVTVDRTPHHVAFTTGENGYAA